MDAKLCGACQLLVNDLEPVRCGFCETYFHISQKCCGFNNRAHKELFAAGQAMFLCLSCRDELQGRSIRAYLADKRDQNNATPTDNNNISTQINELHKFVESLSHKVDCLTWDRAHPEQSITPRPPSTAKWPSLGVKRRRGNNGMPVRPVVADRGTNSIDLSGLSVPFIVPEAPPPKFWLYLSGFQPLITDDDVCQIVARCLSNENPMDVVRLVPKGKDIETLTFVSYKVGLSPDLKQQALTPSSWPEGLLFREFIEKNSNYGLKASSDIYMQSPAVRS